MDNHDGWNSVRAKTNGIPSYTCVGSGDWSYIHHHIIIVFKLLFTRKKTLEEGVGCLASLSHITSGRGNPNSAPITSLIVALECIIACEKCRRADVSGGDHDERAPVLLDMFPRRILPTVCERYGRRILFHFGHYGRYFCQPVTLSSNHCQSSLLEHSGVWVYFA